MSVVEAVERDLAKMGGDLAESAEAATALALAAEMDARNSATSKSMCAKALNETMDKLRAMAPPKEVRDDVTDLAAERRKRRAAAGGSAPSDQSRS